MSILINKDTKVITQGITGKTGQFHTRMCRDYANGKNCFVAGVNPKKAGEDFEGIPIFATVKDAAKNTGATVSVIYLPPVGAAAAIWEAVGADLDLAMLGIECVYHLAHAQCKTWEEYQSNDIEPTRLVGDLYSLMPAGNVPLQPGPVMA